MCRPALLLLERLHAAAGVVRRFLGDVDVVRMALHQTRVGDADEVRVMAQRFDIRRSAVAHAGAQAAQKLEDGVAQRALVGHAAFNAFGHELLRILLEVAILAALLHRREGAHAAIDLELTTLIDFQRARRFLGARQQAAQHDGRA